MSIKLSICIPTYNRGAFIGETLESIVSQATDEVEIVVSDNASTDNTKEVICEFLRRFSRITYFKWAENQGADRNYLKVVELAQGNYCWLMGSDDVLVPGSVERILKEIESQHDIYLCNRTECDRSLQPLRNEFWLKPQIGDRVFEFKENAQFAEYLYAAQSIGALFSYLSSIIVKRSSWDSIIFDESFIGTAYSHAYILLSIIINGGNLKYIHTQFVLCRGENDSFAAEGFVKRFLLDLNGYLALSEIIEDSKLRLKFIDVLQRPHPWYRLVKIRAMSDNRLWSDVKYKLILSHFAWWKIVLADGLGSTLCDYNDETTPSNNLE